MNRNSEPPSAGAPRPVTGRSFFSWAVRGHIWLQALLFALIAVGLVFRVAPLEMQKRIINQAIAMSRKDLLLLYCGLYMGAVTLASLFKFAGNVLSSYLGQRILTRMRRALYAHILSLPMPFFRKSGAGTAVTALSSELNTVGFFLGQAVAVPLSSLLTLLAFAAYMVRENALLALLSLAIYPVEVALVPWLQNRYNRLNVTRVDTTRSMGNLVTEAVAGIHEVKGNAAAALELSKFLKYVKRLERLLNRLFVIKYGVKLLNSLFSGVGPFLLFLIGGMLAIRGQFTLGALVAFLSAYEKIYDPWRELMDYYQDLQDARVRYRRIMEYFDDEPEPEALPGPDKAPPLSGGLSVENLHYTAEGGAVLLSDVSFSLKAGETLALVGYSGSGKSTLGMVLGRLYAPDGGAVRLDGRELSGIPRAELAGSLAYVAQHPALYDGSIRDNMLYGVLALSLLDPSISLPETGELLETAAAVGLSNDLFRFGLNAVIPEERARLMAPTLISLRRELHRRLSESLMAAVEGYHPGRFLMHVDLYRNIVFGDPRDPAFFPDSIVRNKRFRYFLDVENLTEPLLELGLEAAFLAHSRAEHPPGNGADHPAALADVLMRTPHGRGRETLLSLALGIVPADPHSPRVSPALKAKIVLARQDFLRDFNRLDVKTCACRMGENCGHAMEQPPDIPFTAYCPRSYLFSHSLLDNLVFGTPLSGMDQAQAEIVETAESLLSEEGLMDAVRDLGLDFAVGTRGDRLSGGQRQKVALVRALLKKPAILILDEATASLDNASQAAVQKHIAEKLAGRTTVIAVIHRLDLAPGYDRIAVMKDGKIVEMGTYGELMARKGVFYTLAR